jgi:ribosomal protein S18 acetylase RimI-like enzyme
LAPNIIDIRQFDAKAFRPLLLTESQVWNATLRWDYTSSMELVTTCLEEKRLSGYALVNQSHVCGYSFFFYEGDKGLIGNLFVEPGEGTCTDQARCLLDNVLETMLGTPGIRRIETQLPHYATKDLEPAFRARGFESFKRNFMAVSLAPWRAEARRAARPLSSEFQMVPWERQHDREAARLVYLTYRDHVDSAINDQYSSVEGANRLIENIVFHRGCGEHLPHASQVAIHRPSQKLAGILTITSVRAGTAHIPQIAVGNEFQGLGLGSAMMNVSFEALARRGYREVSLTVTEANSGAVRLYERTGFETFQTFGAFVWNRKSSRSKPR